MEGTEEQEDKPVDFIPHRDVLGQVQTPIPLKSEIHDFQQSFNLQNYVLANNWDRFLAGIIDFVIVFVALIIIDAFIFDYPSGLAKKSMSEEILNLIVSNLYFGYYLSSPAQATIGKKVLGIKVVCESGKISFLRAIGRYFASGISFLVLLLGYVSILRDKNKQAWHDMIAGTYVIVDNSAKSKPLSKRRDTAYFILVGFFLVGGFILFLMFNQALENRMQEIDLKDKQMQKRTANEMIKSFEKDIKCVMSDTMYTDTVNKFSIVIKRGMQYSTGTEPVVFVAVDTGMEGMTYVIGRGPTKNSLKAGDFWRSMEQQQPSKYKVSNITVSDIKNGYKMEQADFNVITPEEQDKPHVGIARLYTNDTMYYTVVVDYMTEEQKNKKVKLSDEIFESFKILK